jgi:hypothetical protein
VRNPAILLSIIVVTAVVAIALGRLLPRGDVLDFSHLLAEYERWADAEGLDEGDDADVSSRR